MKEKEKKEKVKKEHTIRIPRLVVYVAAFILSVVICVAFGLAFGLAYAAEFVTSAVVLGVVFMLGYNICEKADEQPWRLTPKYWGLVALILLTDFLLMFCAKAPDMETGKYRVLVLAVAGVTLGFYTYFVYAPSQKELLAEVKKKVKEAVAKYIGEHTGEAPEIVADGLVELVLAPKENVMSKGEENV